MKHNKIGSATRSSLNRRQFAVGLGLTLALVLTGISCSTTAPKPGETQGARDFTFFTLSDVHVGAENLKASPPVTAADTLARVRQHLATMQGLVGKPYPDRLEFAGLGRIGTPRGLLILGDLTDGHKERARAEEQWREFNGVFPALGLQFGVQEVPVFALAGNHDGEIPGPQRLGLIERNRALQNAGELSAISSNGVHLAFNWQGVHFISLALCPADSTDPETPFKYGKPGPGSWNDPQGAFTFLKNYLESQVRTSGDPVVVMHHYGFDGFSMNDWNWWTPMQRKALYQLLAKYNVAAIFHGHDHHAGHYKWPDPKSHAEDLKLYFDGQVPEKFRQYDIISNGPTCWVMRVQGDQLVAVHFNGADFSDNSADIFVKSLKPASNP